MKYFLFFSMAVAFCLTACNNDKKVSTTTKNEDGTTTTTTVDVKGMTASSEGVDKKIEELKKLTPLTIDQLKALLPEELNGIKQSNYNSSTMMGFALISADYKKDDTSTLKVAVYDCAGESGSAWYAATYWTKMNFQQESSTEYTKTIDLLGGKAVENYNKENNTSSLTYAANDRLLVVLTGENIKPEELRTAAQKLNLKLS